MTGIQIVFILVAGVTLGAALLVVLSRNLIHSALWLIATLFGVAIFYGILNAGFLAVAQVVIYIGAIATLIIFAVMMTRQLTAPMRQTINSSWWLAMVVSALLFAGLTWMLSSWGGFATQAPELASGTDSLVQLGESLVSPNAYVLPFELASVLLLAALVGAIMIAWQRGFRSTSGQ